MGVDDHVIHLANGRLADDTPPDAVKELVRRALAHGGNGIVIHFHGGLVSYDRGIQVAQTLHPEYLAADAYPVFFVWESGLVETITNNLKDIAQEGIFVLAWKRLTNIVLRRIGQTDDQRAAGVLPPADDLEINIAIDRAIDDRDSGPLDATEPAVDTSVEELSSAEEFVLEQELSMDIELTAEIERISSGLRTPEEIAADEVARSGTVRGSTETLMDPAQLATLVDRPDPTERGIISTAAMIKKIVSIAAGVIKRFATDRDHGFHSTIVEEILRGLYLANVGGVIWGQMKQDTADAFASDGLVHGGTAFLDALSNEMDENDPPTITLVGHSTGAVFISEFLDKAVERLPASVRFGVVLEAPALTFQKSSDAIAHHGDRIAGFRMFSMNDDLEQVDRLVPFLYPHSLLYFVSGVVEGTADTPILGMARFHDRSKFPNQDHPDLIVARDYVSQSENRAVWSVTDDQAPSGQRSTARRHGDFDDQDRPTLDSVKHIIGEGFEGGG